MRPVYLSLGTFSLLAHSTATSLKHPEGPSQQCQDDAGPPWMDDEAPYFAGFAAKPKLLNNGDCPRPLSSACRRKGALAAFHDGPVDCGGAGWFCIITEQDGHRNPEIPTGFPDSNFAFCERKGIDPGHDKSGHCHGSDVDKVYGWWVRDHWHRNYAGKLKCCCNWKASAGVVNRCDYRKEVTRDALNSCRDANEEHTVDWSPNCAGSLRGGGIKWPPMQQCWEMEGFGPAGLERDNGGDGDGDNGSPTSKPTKEVDDDDDNTTPTSEPTKNVDDDDGGEDGVNTDNCNPNMEDVVVCKNGRSGRKWNICGNGNKKFSERKYCPSGWSMCENGKCFVKDSSCRGKLKYSSEACNNDGDDGENDGDDGENDDEDGDDGENDGDDGENDDEDGDGDGDGDGEDDGDENSEGEPRVFPRSTGTEVSKLYGKVYIVGSSELDGMGSTQRAIESTLASALGTVVVNNAVGGVTLNEIKTFPACSSDKNCMWSILSGGINGDRKKSPKQMRSLIRRELAEGKKVIVVGYSGDCEGYASGADFEHFLNVYERFSKKTKNVWFINSRNFPGHPLMGEPCNPDSRRYRADDNSHPSPLTGKLWGERIAAIIMKQQRQRL